MCPLSTKANQVVNVNVTANTNANLFHIDCLCIFVFPYQRFLKQSSGDTSKTDEKTQQPSVDQSKCVKDKSLEAVGSAEPAKDNKTEGCFW